MDKPELRARVRYWFDNVMARGTVAVIVLLGLVSLAWVLAAGLLAWLVGVNPDGERYGFVEATWRQLTFTLDPGTFSGDIGWAWRLVSLLTTLFGLLVVASLIGVVSAAFDGRVAQLRRGRSAALETDHTVILGWSAKVFTIIAELVVANESEHKPAIVVLADRDRIDMEEAIRERVPHRKNTRVICRSGDPLDPHDLLRANPYAARSIIVLGDESAIDADAATIKTTLALTNNPARPDGAVSVVGEIRNPTNLPVAQLVGKEEAQWVLPLETISRITAQTCRQPGLSKVYSEILNFDGDEVYVTRQPELVGRTFRECQLRFRTAALMGIIGAGRAVMNPPSNHVLAADEELIVIADDDSTIELSEPGRGDAALVTGTASGVEPPERVLVLGSHSQLPLILSELDQYTAPGSQVSIVSDREIPEWGPMAHLDIDARAGATWDRTVLESLEPHTYDHVVVLAYRDHLGVEAADSRTLVTLLHLRELTTELRGGFNIVSEMLDDRNRRLAEVTRADDFIVSDNIISLMMAQISANPTLREVYSTLFSSGGSEFYLRPAEWYVTLGAPVDFYTVVAGAAQRRETAIGYCDRTPSKAEFGQPAMCINPDKAAKRRYAAGDRIVVLAES